MFTENVFYRGVQICKNISMGFEDYWYIFIGINKLGYLEGTEAAYYV